ncbi:MAG: MlaD family protein [Kiritimatiellia bacterium]
MKPGVIERTITREIIVGTFLLMILLGLGYFTIILSRERLFQPRYRWEIIFSDVMGLREADNVVVRGMPVGKVLSLKLKDEGVHVLVSLTQRIRIRQDSEISIVATSILGGRYLQITEGSPDSPEVPEGTVLRGRDPYDLMADAAKLVNAARRGVVEGNMIENFRVASEQLREISTRLATGQGTLGRLLSADDRLYQDIAASATSLRTLTGRLERGEGVAGKLLSRDEQFYKDLSEAIAALKNLATRIEKGEGTLGKLLSADDKIYRDLDSAVSSLKAVAERLEKGEGTLGKLMATDDQLYKDLSAAAASLRTVATKIEKGEGLVGRLMQDDTLYKEIRQTIDELRATIDDFRETAPVTTFTSLFLGAF